jgi:hypothetical protein
LLLLFFYDHWPLRSSLSTSIYLRYAELKNWFEVLEFEFFGRTHLIISLLTLRLSNSGNDLNKLAITITLHLDAFEWMFFYFCLIVNLLPAWASEQWLLLKAPADSWRVVPGESCTLLDIVIIRVHTLLNLWLIIGEQVIHIIIS